VTDFVTQARKVSEGATPGPWYVIVNDLIGGKSVATADVPASAIDPKGSVRVPADMLGSDADATFIAFARNHWDAMVDVVEAATEFPLVPDVPGWKGPPPVWADWHRRLDAALARLEASTKETV
jgi:hypothetical protein